MPHPAQPLPSLVLQRGGGGTPFCDSDSTLGGGSPSEELREEGEDNDLHLEPVKASGLSWGGVGETPTVARLTACPDPSLWQPGKGEATRSYPVRDRGAQRRGTPGEERQ